MRPKENTIPFVAEASRSNGLRGFKVGKKKRWLFDRQMVVETAAYLKSMSNMKWPRALLVGQHAKKMKLPTT